MAKQGQETQKSGEHDGGVATDIVKGFIDRRIAESEAIKARGEHAAAASAMASGLWEGYDIDEVNERARAYTEKTGDGFREGPGGPFPGAYQYPFIEVAPGVEMTIRELTSGEERHGPRDGGPVISIKMVVKAGGLPGPEERDRCTGNVAGEAVFATVYGEGTDNGLIGHADPAINNDPLAAEATDREVLGQLEAVQTGIRRLLGY